MANLNPHDIVFLDSPEFKGFKRKIEDEYGLKILSTALPDIVSFTSKKLVLNTSKGIFFLKEKPQYCSDEVSLARAAHFQDFIASQMDIVPKILSTKEQNYYINWKERYYFLTEYKKGRYYNGSQKDIDSMIDALYIFQQCGATYLKEYKDSRPDELARFESPDVASGIPDIKSKIKSQGDEAIFREILLLYEDLCSEYVSLSKEGYIMSHGDFILFNLILNETGVVAINDFDNAKVLPRIHDTAEFLVSASLLNYVAPLTNLKFPILAGPDETTFIYIIKNYVSKFMLSNNEIVLLGTVAEIVWLWTLVLSVFKGDYSLSDLRPAIDTLRSRNVKSLVNNFCV
jgi:hypothetical protein